MCREELPFLQQLQNIKKFLSFSSGKKKKKPTHFSFRFLITPALFFLLALKFLLQVLILVQTHPIISCSHLFIITHITCHFSLPLSSVPQNFLYFCPYRLWSFPVSSCQLTGAYHWTVFCHKEKPVQITV